MSALPILPPPTTTRRVTTLSSTLDQRPRSELGVQAAKPACGYRPAVTGRHGCTSTRRAQPVARGRRKCPRRTGRTPRRRRSRPGSRSARAGRASSSPRPPRPLPGCRTPRPRGRRGRTTPNAKAPGNSLPPCSTSRAAHAAEVPRSAPVRQDRAPRPSRASAATSASPLGPLGPPTTTSWALGMDCTRSSKALSATSAPFRG